MNCLQGLRLGMNRVLHVFAKEEAAICCSRLGPAAVRWGFRNPDRSSCWVPADAGSRRKPASLLPASPYLSRPPGLNRRYAREPPKVVIGLSNVQASYV